MVERQLTNERTAMNWAIFADVITFLGALIALWQLGAKYGVVR
jgi:hypothetical protein